MNNDDAIFRQLGTEREVLTVSQLNARARRLLEEVFPAVWVEGELSNLARPSSGHLYFTLKDSGAQVRCALFRQNAARVRMDLRDGLLVRARCPRTQPGSASSPRPAARRCATSSACSAGARPLSNW